MGGMVVCDKICLGVVSTLVFPGIRVKLPG